MTRGLWPLLAGFALWAIGFVALYALQALGCLWQWHPPLHRTALIIGYCLLLAGLVALIWRQRSDLRTSRTRAKFLIEAGLWTTYAALLASLLIFAPILIADTCR